MRIPQESHADYPNIPEVQARFSEIVQKAADIKPIMAEIAEGMLHRSTRLARYSLCPRGQAAPYPNGEIIKGPLRTHYKPRVRPFRSQRVLTLVTISQVDATSLGESRFTKISSR